MLFPCIREASRWHSWKTNYCIFLKQKSYRVHSAFSHLLSGIAPRLPADVNSLSTLGGLQVDRSLFKIVHCLWTVKTTRITWRIKKTAFPCIYTTIKQDWLLKSFHLFHTCEDYKDYFVVYNLDRYHKLTDFHWSIFCTLQFSNYDKKYPYYLITDITNWIQHISTDGAEKRHNDFPQYQLH